MTREEARLHAIAFTPDRDGLIAVGSNIRHLQKRIKALQQAAAELAAREPELASQVERLCSVPGIGKVSALRLLGELLVLPTDLKAKQWVAHAGLDPRPRQSGTQDAPRHISRTGNRHLRLALFVPALVAIQRSSQIKATYEALLARGKKLGHYLEATFLSEARPHRRNVRLGIAQHGGRCVDRVGTEDEFVLVRDGRAENEFSVGQRLELDRLARRLESRQVAVPQLVGNRHSAGCDGGPQDSVACRRLVAPALAGLQAMTIGIFR